MHTLLTNQKYFIAAIFMTKEEKEEFKWITVMLAFVIFVFFIFQNFSPYIFDALILDSSRIFSHPWSLITYIFLHGNLTHLLSNLFSLVMFGSILEKIVGYKKFLFVFFSAGIFSGIAGSFFYNSMIGASGAIFGVVGTLVAIRPKMVVLAFGAPLPLVVAVIMWVLLDLGGVFYPTSIGNIGHLAGLFVGIAIGISIRPKYKLPEQKKKTRFKLDEEYFRRWEEKYMK